MPVPTWSLQSSAPGQVPEDNDDSIGAGAVGLQNTQFSSISDRGVKQCSPWGGIWQFPTVDTFILCPCNLTCGKLPNRHTCKCMRCSVHERAVLWSSLEPSHQPGTRGHPQLHMGTAPVRQ